jgi:uncharacterized membrane protein (DUF485 family)
MPPENENTSRRPIDPSEWDRIAATPEFHRLLAAKKSFILPAFLFFCVYHFLLPILVAFAPGPMSIPVAGALTLGWLFALSQFVVGGIIAWLYLRAASRFDALTKDVLNRASADEGTK